MTLTLTQFERRWAHATLDTIFPGPDRGVLPVGIESLDVDGFLDETLARIPFEAAVGLRAAFWMIALAPLFVIGKLATIASLSQADRLRVLSAINASSVYPVRAMVIMVKAIGALFYCGDSRVKPSIVAVLPPVVTLRLRQGGRSSSSHAQPGAEHEPHRRTA